LNDVGFHHVDYDDAAKILQVLFDKISQKVLLSTIDSAKTVSEICFENRIPASSTYKKIKQLQHAGFIYVEKTSINRNRKKVVLYRSRIKSLNLTFDQNGMNLQVVKNDG
jgi:predicted transcriptional regulator